MTDMRASGVLIALPRVETKAGILVFQRWTPETKMVCGGWSVPASEIVFALPLGGHTSGLRLGFGGECFGRALPSLSPRPSALGLGYQTARPTTTYPQPHDIAPDSIFNEVGVQVENGAP